MAKAPEPYIKESELLAENHFPVYALFNEVFSKYFIKMVESASMGYGFGAAYGACCFPIDLAESGVPPSEIPNGVVFSLHNGEETLLDYSTYYNYYLNKVCKRHIKMYPDTEQELTELLEKTKLTLESLNGEPLHPIVAD